MNKSLSEKLISYNGQSFYFEHIYSKSSINLNICMPFVIIENLIDGFYYQMENISEINDFSYKECHMNMKKTLSVLSLFIKIYKVFH